ncbi:MAG: CapA family protein, partial [Gemmatimonadaceae bacterium]
YGCGDFLSDYEGIRGHEKYRSDLALMYFPTLDANTGQLRSLRVTPMHIRQMQATRASRADAAWLAQTLTQVSRKFGVHIDVIPGAIPRLALSSDA